MKIIATVIEINVGVAITRGMKIDPYTAFIATWAAPNGVRITTAPQETKQVAIDELKPQVRGLITDSHWLNVEDVEVEL